MAAGPEPFHLSQALSELIALRGYARVRGDGQLKSAWLEVAGPELGKTTRVLGLSRGVLQVGVPSAALLAELVAFHRHALLAALKEKHPGLKVRDLKFRLKGELGPG